jgi:hypothetical protein
VTIRKPACEALLHPIALLALAVWLINDHHGKAAYGGWVTGKLSDVACLIVVPLVPVAALELWRARRGLAPPGRTWQYASLAAAGLVMATINLLDGAAWAYRHGLGVAQWPIAAISGVLAGHGLPPLRPVQLTMDASDLLVLPILVVPWLLMSGNVSLARGAGAGITAP